MIPHVNGALQHRIRRLGRTGCSGSPTAHQQQQLAVRPFDVRCFVRHSSSTTMLLVLRPNHIACHVGSSCSSTRHSLTEWSWVLQHRCSGANLLVGHDRIVAARSKPVCNPVSGTVVFGCAGRLNGGLSSAAAAAADTTGHSGARLKAASSADSRDLRAATSNLPSDMTASSNYSDAASTALDGGGDSRAAQGGSPTSTLHPGALVTSGSMPPIVLKRYWLACLSPVLPTSSEPRKLMLRCGLRWSFATNALVCTKPLHVRALMPGICKIDGKGF